MAQMTFFSTPSPAPEPATPAPEPKARRFSLQLHNPLPPYYGRRKRPIPENKAEPDAVTKSSQLKAQGELLKAKQVKVGPAVAPAVAHAAQPSPARPAGLQPMPRLQRPLPRTPVDDRCRCSVCQRAEGEYTLLRRSSHAAALIESDRLSRLSLTSVESVLTE
ncbi:hypothetical protein CspeluHIS016_0111350 [Cutaneotrichosporon spelunceum]|uniref:Uncharacterized protein n=1 Tax=Cutaneotrichosporon spelunceum TaxID=1672016 RepID=A0AAD3YAB5_9TREE|nr:hypothetical protein CspeluHIS016_0111350 [Cutaneotrichosporon spelunceum]